MNQGTRNLLLLAVFALCLFNYVFVTVDPAQAQNRPSIAVADFEVKTGRAYQLGRGMSDMLVNALVETNQFTVVERDRLDKIMQEQGMALQGLVDASTGAQVGQMLGAQFLVLGAIIEFDERVGGGAVGGILSRKLGGGAAMYTAHIGLTLRVIDATSGVIHASKSIDKKKNTIGAAGGGSILGVPIGGVGFKSKAMQDVVEEAIQEAVALLSAELKDVPGLTASGAAGSNGASNMGPPADCSSMMGASAPRLMIVIPEGYGSPAGETEILRRFLEAGLNLVDQKQIDAIRDQEKVIHAYKDPRLAAELGAEFGADVIIIGEARSEGAGRTGNMTSSRAHVEARAIETRTGRILAANGTDGSGADISREAAARKAFRSAATALANYLLGQLCGQTLQTGPAVRTIEVMFSGISFGDLQQAASAIASVSGVQDVKKSLTGSVGRLQVQYAGNTEALANALMNLSSLKLEIVGFESSKLEAKVVK